MARVNKLTGKGTPKATGTATPTKPAPQPSQPPRNPNPPRTGNGRETQTITQKDVGTVRVGNGNNAALQKSAKGLQLPAFLQELHLPELVPGGVNAGYVGFVDQKSKKYGLMKDAGCDDGDPFIFYQQQYHLAKPLEFFLLKGDSFRTTMVGQDGKFMFVTRDIDTPLRQLAEEAPEKMKPHILKAEPHYSCLLLALLGDTLVPVKADFRGTKAGAGSSAILAVKSAAEPDWLRISNDHKATAVFPQPFGRVWNSVTTKYKVGKGSGNSFYVANCVSKPATMDQMQLLVNYFNDPDSVAELEDAERTYETRVAFLDKIAEGESDPEEQAKDANGNPVPF